MRIIAFISLLLTALSAVAKPQLVINELQASNRTTLRTANGATPDWIELYNAGTVAADLVGMRIAINGRQHVIDAPIRIAAKGFVLLYCDGRTDEGPEHLGFSLERTGGTVLLIAADGYTILDLFTYPELPTDASMGRLPDGSKAWSFFVQPSPGTRCDKDQLTVIRTWTAAPAVNFVEVTISEQVEVTLIAPEPSVIRYTTDATPPSTSNGHIYEAPLLLPRGTVLRAMAFAPNAWPSPEVCVTLPGATPVTRSLSLVLDPQDLWSDSTGIMTHGSFANHTRSGRAWERAGWLQENGEPASPVGIRVSGSGSRGLAKRSLKVYARDGDGSAAKAFTFADGTTCDELMLRADAGPLAFLRNMLMETVVHQYGLNVEVQPSEPVEVLLNGEPWGLYRRMPPKDAEWLKQRSGAEAVDVLEGPAFVARSGSNARFLLAEQALTSGADPDSLAVRIDLNSLIDLACIDLYTGRADHDLNVRCFRPKQLGGRWRWVLFDMDLWAPAHENSVERMCAASVAETPFVPQLLSHPMLQQRLLARITALQATAFNTRSLQQLADSIHRVNAAALEADHARWSNTLVRPEPPAALEQLAQFTKERPEHLFAHLAERTGRRVREVVIEAPPAERGRLLLEGLPMPPGRHVVRCFEGVAMNLTAEPAPDHEWAGWKGARGETAQLTVDLARSGTIKVLFRPLAP
ncbi:MAG: CotH kinase family protein [Flavobacteriales bacterium]|nr:CotH kinase family protein [Flavobacteriales bacterium]